MKNLIDLNDFSLDEIFHIIEKANEVKKNPEKFKDLMKGKILATLFFEPSTRTQFSFQTAMYRLGGNTIGFSNSLDSSISKGENLKDTIKVVSEYADILVIRHFLEGAALAASFYSSCPVINAGDGGHLHPTQTLTDIFTILEYKEKLDGLNIGLCGDLKFSRTINSLVDFLNRYKNNKFTLISSENFRLSSKLKEKIKRSNNVVFESDSLKESISSLDILYMTRIQKERFKEEKNIKEDLILLDKEVLKNAKKDLIIMHPLPRTKEIDIKIDSDPRAIYFKQAQNGVFVRMALILSIFSYKERKEEGVLNFDFLCKNRNCITNFEEYLKKQVKKTKEGEFCRYCEREI